MKKIYITGDRSMSAIAAVKVVFAVLKDIVENEGPGNFAIGTGNCILGVERAVRYLVPEESMNLAAYEQDADGNVDFESTFRELEPLTDVVIFLHMDPLSSHIGRALGAIFPPEKVVMPLQDAMTETL